MPLTPQLTTHLTKTTYDDLDDATIEATKRSILDTLGVMLPPTTLDPTYRALHGIVTTVGGNPESTVVGFGGATSCVMAAFINGALCHGLDFDDTTDDPPHHPTANTLPVSLALAERRGGVTGKELITAVALANDFAIRLASAPRGSVVMDYSFLPITTFGLMSSAVAGAKVLGLADDELQSALGLALHQVGGVTEALMAPESDVRAVRDGFANKAAVLAVLMAQNGIKAARNAVELFFEVFYRGDVDESAITADLGVHNRSKEIGLKPWPCDRETHGYIEGALAIRRAHGLRSDDIDQVVVAAGSFGRARLFEPDDLKRRPFRSIGAKLSMPFVLGVALTRGRVTIADFLPDQLDDPDILLMADKVSYTVDDSVWPPGTGSPAYTEIHTTAGEVHSARVEVLKGHPGNPLTRADIEAKFLDCATYSARPVDYEEARRLATAIWDLDQVDDVAELLRPLR